MANVLIRGTSGNLADVTVEGKLKVDAQVADSKIKGSPDAGVTWVPVKVDANGQLLVAIPDGVSLNGSSISEAQAIPTKLMNSIVHQNVYVNKGLVNVGKSVPLYQYLVVSVPANTTTPTEFDVVTVPAGKAWLIATTVIQTSPNGVVSKLLLDGKPTGQWVGNNSYSERYLITWFGDYIVVVDRVKVEATNSGASAQDQTVVLYGWEVTL